MARKVVYQEVPFRHYNDLHKWIEKPIYKKRIFGYGEIKEEARGTFLVLVNDDGSSPEIIDKFLEMYLVRNVQRYEFGEDLNQGTDNSIMEDKVNHPSHYCSDPSGVECIQITEHRDFLIGNAIKYLWRAGIKKDADKTDKEKEIEDLQKAIFYINRRISNLKK
ncbi:DUF3310 domain-containing protein [Dysgonomonas capnocytophagoides]|uniref:DUF3310 domain-containing protein n=1 Tax=Dysgonomonas capnocytophagoides TaxID=45254 RepID=UPI0029247DAF|nr:hypothetical protein DCPSUM001_33540 [Dysgonomonas capnocytophagoides]